VFDHAYDSPESLRRLLHFFASLRDQYSAVILTLPVDLPLNQLLRESQVPHRPVNHDTADTRLYTRMQVRVLDHVRLLEAMRLPEHVRGQFSVAIRETEGEVTRLFVEIENGRAVARPTGGEVDIECTDVRWASMILGDLPASTAARMGLIIAHNAGALSLLDRYCDGPAPFCTEYF
jgi:predicted acetyltransferase